MALIDEINNIKPITNNSFTGIVNSSNFNFELIAEILANFIDEIGLSNGTLDIDGITTDNLHINNKLTVGSNNSVTISQQGIVSTKTINTQIGEIKRLQFKDFPNYPTQGKIGEIIWTGDDFLGFTSLGWLSLTTISGSSPGSDLGIGIEDDKNHILSAVDNINFGIALDVTDDGDGTVTIDTIEYLSPTTTISTNVNNILEVGDQISSIDITWSMTNSTNIIDNTTKIYDSTQTLFDNLSKDDDSPQTYNYSTPVSYNSVNSHVWTVEAEDTRNNIFNESFTTNWYFALYHGTSSNTTLSESDIESLSNKNLASTSNWKGVLSFSSNNYKYIAIPTSYDSPTIIQDNESGVSVPMADTNDGYNNFDGHFYFDQVSVTNQYGVQQDYRVYRTKNQINSNIDLDFR